MAAIRATGRTTLLGRSIVHSQMLFRLTPSGIGSDRVHRMIPAGNCPVRRASTKSVDRSLARKPEVQRLLYQAEERYKPGGGVEPVPKITLDHVTISYANSGQGGPNVSKVSSKVEMRWNVKDAHWLSERIRERIMQMEKSRINKDGEIVITSAKTRAQKSNSEDAVAKLQVFAYQKKKLQAIIDAASYVPLPPSQETVKKIATLSVLSEQKRLEKKKSQPSKVGSQQPETTGEESEITSDAE